MRKSYIYTTALEELERKIEFEKTKIDSYAKGVIAPARLEKYNSEKAELNSMILDAEDAESEERYVVNHSRYNVGGRV